MHEETDREGDASVALSRLTHTVRKLTRKILDAQGRFTQEYECPECGKVYQADAAVQPEVHLLRPRSDGKDDRYQDTMF